MENVLVLRKKLANLGVKNLEDYKAVGDDGSNNITGLEDQIFASDGIYYNQIYGLNLLGFYTTYSSNFPENLNYPLSIQGCCDYLLGDYLKTFLLKNLDKYYFEIRNCLTNNILAIHVSSDKLYLLNEFSVEHMERADQELPEFIIEKQLFYDVIIESINIPSRTLYKDILNELEKYYLENS